MSRPVILPALLVAIAVIGLAGARTARMRDARHQREKDRAARDDSIQSSFAAQRDSEVSARHAASASACPKELQDVAAWPAETADSLPVTVPEIPDFAIDSRMLARDDRVDFRSEDGDSYSVSYSPGAGGLESWPQYELVAECADLADVMPGTIQTAREKAAGSFTKVVLASYRLPDGNFLSFHGTTQDVQRQTLFVAAAHHMRLKR